MAFSFMTAQRALPAVLAAVSTVATAQAATEQRVEPEALCRAALDAVQRARANLPADATLVAACAPALPAASVGAGPVQLQAALESLRLLDGPQDIAVEIRVAQRRQRVARVPVRIELQASQWCASEGVAAGEALLPAQFAACRQPVRQAAQWALAGQPLPDGRLKRALHAGDVLLATDVVDTRQQLRGDAVTVVYRVGALTLQSAGELNQDGRIGQPVRVRLHGTHEAVAGRLVATGRVEIEEQP